jgi:TolA-binding protein
MKVWVVGPAQAAKVPDLEEPRWAHFEKVHVSLNVDEALARKDKFPDTHVNQERAVAPSAVSLPAVGEGHQRMVPPEELQMQIRELSSTNQKLRGRLDEQSGRMQQLQDQLEQLRHALPPQVPKQRPQDTRPAE